MLNAKKSQASQQVQTARLCGKGGRAYKNLPSKCRYLVSVGKINFEGDRLEATLGLINAEYKVCTVIVTGTLQRFNLAIQHGVSLEEAYDLALEKERKWIDNAKAILNRIESLNCKFEFISWEDYRTHEDFAKYSDEVSTLLEQREDFQIAMDQTVDNFCKRHETIDEEIFTRCETQYRENSRKFLTEECAAMFLWGNNGDGSLLYPAEASPILDKMMIHINEIQKRKDDSRLSWQSIRFKHVNIEDWSEVTTANRESKKFLDTAIFQRPPQVQQAKINSHSYVGDLLSLLGGHPIFSSSPSYKNGASKHNTDSKDLSCDPRDIIRLQITLTNFKLMLDEMSTKYSGVYVQGMIQTMLQEMENLSMPDYLASNKVGVNGYGLS